MRFKTEAVLILVVDDCADIGNVLKKLLERQGYSVRCASSGEEALAEMHARCPKMVILDEQLPGMTGLEIFLQMRQDGRLRDVPVVFFSAQNVGESSRLALKAGAVGWIVKSERGWKEIQEMTHAACPLPERQLPERNAMSIE